VICPLITPRHIQTGAPEVHALDVHTEARGQRLRIRQAEPRSVKNEYSLLSVRRDMIRLNGNKAEKCVISPGIDSIMKALSRLTKGGLSWRKRIQIRV